MHGGFEKYYQIARCFRDEDLRSDRQPEFSQLDLEMAFASSDKIMQFVEAMMRKLIATFKQVDLPPFVQLSYSEAWELYGSDKPDTRFAMLLQHNPQWVEAPEENVIVLVAKSFCDRKTLDQVQLICDQYQFHQFFTGKILANGKFVSSANLPFQVDEAKMRQNCGEQKQLFFFCHQQRRAAEKVAGAVRFYLGQALQLYDSQQYRFLWVVDWPMFHYSEREKRYKAVHHPFTKPHAQQDLNRPMADWMSDAFDIVCNGVELGGGSLRINDAKMQHQVLRFLQVNEPAIAANFGWLLTALTYSPVSHGGLALGIDRLLMLLTDSVSLRDVIAFPKNNQGLDLMTQSSLKPEPQQK